MSRLVSKELTFSSDSCFAAKMVKKIEDLRQYIASLSISNANVRFRMIVVKDCQLN